jgi:hypothetical protein
VLRVLRQLLGQIEKGLARFGDGQPGHVRLLCTAECT